MASRTRTRRGTATVAVLAVLAAALAIALTPAAPAAAATPPPLPHPDSHGIDLTRWEPAPDDNSTPEQWRLVDASMRTDAIYRNGSTYEIKVRILLPPNYQTDPSRPYPVLWLLHGGAGNFDDWSTDGRVKELVSASRFNGIVVMPEAGSTGWYVDWEGHADGGHWPDWETFHIGQLLPWVDTNFNTDPTRAGRAIAGLSMGGYGALKYAARHPDLFSAVGSFSGATNIRLRDAATGGAANVPPTIGSHMGLQGACIRYPERPFPLPSGNCGDADQFVRGSVPPWEHEAYAMQTLFGPESNYPNVNPWDMAGAFTAYDGRVGIYSGGFRSGERDFYAHARSLHDELDRRGVQHHWCVGAGGHDWSHWTRDLTDFLNLAYGSSATCHYVPD